MKLSSANTFTLDKAKILSSGKRFTMDFQHEFRLYMKAFENMMNQRWYLYFFLFHHVFYPVKNQFHHSTTQLK